MNELENVLKYLEYKNTKKKIHKNIYEYIQVHTFLMVIQELNALPFAQI